MLIFITISHFIKLPTEDEKQEQKRDFKAFFFLKAEAKWKLASAFPWGQGLGEQRLALVAEAFNSGSLSWELVDLGGWGQRLVITRMSSQLSGRGLRDLTFMVEPSPWASDREVTRILGGLSPRPSQSQEELRTLMFPFWLV